MLNVQLLRTLRLETADGQRHLSAASGLVWLGRRLYVVADDEHMLGVFDLADERPGTLLRLVRGELPAAPEARKAAKPDLEALALLPAFAGYPHGALLALGSGSRAQRRRAAVVALDEAGEPRGAVREIDLSNLYAPLQAQHALLNIEGGFVSDGRFCLLQRGNQADPSNFLICFDWPATAAWLVGVEPAPPPLACTRFELGEIDGVPLCFTDGAALPGGGWVFCAAAEASVDNYADGPCRGSAVGVVAADGRLLGLQTLSLCCKAEGIAAVVEGGRLQLLMVTDADDPAAPALLLAASFEHPGPHEFKYTHD